MSRFILPVMDLLTILYGPGAITLYITTFLSLVIWWQLPLADPPFTPTQPVPPTRYLITPVGLYYLVSIIELFFHLNGASRSGESDITPPALFVVESFLIIAPLLIIRETERSNRASMIGKDRRTLLCLLCIPGISLEFYNCWMIVCRPSPRPPVLGIIRPSWLTASWYALGLGLMKLTTMNMAGIFWPILPAVVIITWEAIFATWPEGTGNQPFWAFRVASRSQKAPEQLLFTIVGVALLARVLYITFRSRGTIYRNILIWIERRRRRGELTIVDDGQGGARLVSRDWEGIYELAGNL